MIPTETPSIKGTGSSTEQKPATIVYHPPDGRDPQVGAATHHIVTSDREVHVYLGDRREGIDSTLPLDRCEIHRSDKGRETFGTDGDASAGDGSGRTEDGDSGPHADVDSPELVTDGGQVIEPGDVVSHEERGRHRVAHLNESHVEIYRLGDGSDVVPLSSVEIVPESVAADGGDT